MRLSREKYVTVSNFVGGISTASAAGVGTSSKTN